MESVTLAASGNVVAVNGRPALGTQRPMKKKARHSGPLAGLAKTPDSDRGQPWHTQEDQANLKSMSMLKTDGTPLQGTKPEAKGPAAVDGILLANMARDSGKRSELKHHNEAAAQARSRVMTGSWRRTTQTLMLMHPLLAAATPLPRRSVRLKDPLNLSMSVISCLAPTPTGACLRLSTVMAPMEMVCLPIGTNELRQIVSRFPR